MNKGQTIILLLVFVLVAIIVTTASIISMSVNIQASEKVATGTATYDLAESGAENAMIKLLRDPAYSGENLQLSQGNLQITITGTNPKIIISAATINNYVRKIEVTVDTTNNVLSVIAWKEII